MLWQSLALQLISGRAHYDDDCRVYFHIVCGAHTHGNSEAALSIYILWAARNGDVLTPVSILTATLEGLSSQNSHYWKQSYFPKYFSFYGYL